MQQYFQNYGIIINAPPTFHFIVVYVVALLHDNLYLICNKNAINFDDTAKFKQFVGKYATF